MPQRGPPKGLAYYADISRHTRLEWGILLAIGFLAVLLVYFLILLIATEN